MVALPSQQPKSSLRRAGNDGVLEHEGLDVEHARLHMLQQVFQGPTAALEGQVLYRGVHDDGPRPTLDLHRRAAMVVGVVPVRICGESQLASLRYPDHEVCWLLQSLQAWPQSDSMMHFCRQSH